VRTLAANRMEQRNFPLYMDTQEYITLLARASIGPYPEALNPVHSHSVSLRPVLILFFYVCVCFTSGRLPSDISAKNLYAFSISFCPFRLTYRFTTSEVVRIIRM
jgi:hypothetical protein